MPLPDELGEVGPRLERDPAGQPVGRDRRDDERGAHDRGVAQPAAQVRDRPRRRTGPPSPPPTPATAVFEAAIATSQTRVGPQAAGSSAAKPEQDEAAVGDHEVARRVAQVVLDERRQRARRPASPARAARSAPARPRAAGRAARAAGRRSRSPATPSGTGIHASSSGSEIGGATSASRGTRRWNGIDAQPDGDDEGDGDREQADHGPGLGRRVGRGLAQPRRRSPARRTRGPRPPARPRRRRRGRRSPASATRSSRAAGGDGVAVDEQHRERGQPDGTRRERSQGQVGGGERDGPADDRGQRGRQQAAQAVEAAEQPADARRAGRRRAPTARRPAGGSRWGRGGR